MELETAMKSLLLIFLTLYISGCGEPNPCKPVPCVQNYPKLPIYSIPKKKHMTEPVSIGGGMYAVVGTELRDCLVVNAKLRKICSNYGKINYRINKEYQK